MRFEAKLTDELLAMLQRDTATRERLLAQQRLYGDYAPEMQQVHRENATRLAALIERHGWPGPALVGLEACRAAWIIAQHAICTPQLQRGFLAALRASVESGDAPERQLAWLTDRVRFNEGRPQVYGTVLDWDDDGVLTCEVEDPKGVDERRAKVGLPPFAEELQRHRDAVAAEGGRPPDDLADYRRRQREWAAGVGWI